MLENALEAYLESEHRSGSHGFCWANRLMARWRQKSASNMGNNADDLRSHAGCALRRWRRDAAPFVAAARTPASTSSSQNVPERPQSARRAFLRRGRRLESALDDAKGAAAKAPSEETLELAHRGARSSTQDGAFAAIAATETEASCPLRAEPRADRRRAHQV